MLFLCHASLTNHESQVGFVFLLEYDDGGGKHSSVSSVQHDDHHHEHEDESGDDSGDDCGNGTKSNPRPHPYLALNLAPDDPWWRALERDGAVRLRNLITPEQALIAKPMSATHQRH